MSPEIATAAQAAFERYKNAGGDVSRVTMETDPTVCAKVCRFPHLHVLPAVLLPLTN